MKRPSLRKAAGALLAAFALALAAGTAFVAADGQNRSVLRHEADNLICDLKDLSGIDLASPIDWDGQPEEVVAWIEIPGTRVDYPVVQASPSSPDYYLTHDQYGQYDVYGIPFIAAGCEKGIDSPNVIICAHHMDDGSMFADVAGFSRSEFAQEHRDVLIYTRERTYELKVKGAQIIDGSSELATTQFADSQDYADWVSKTNDRSCATLASLDPSRQTFTLCTCSYTTYRNERTLVFCQ